MAGIKYNGSLQKYLLHDFYEVQKKSNPTLRPIYNICISKHLPYMLEMERHLDQENLKKNYLFGFWNSYKSDMKPPTQPRLFNLIASDEWLLLASVT